MVASKRMVRVDVESELYLPEWVLKTKAVERVKKLMEQDAPPAAVRTMDSLRDMKPGDKVPGIVQVAPGLDDRHRDFLFVPSLGMLEKAEVEDLVGRVKEGGYGKGPEHKAPNKGEWKSIVGNFVDWLYEKRGNKRKLWS